jgi:metal-dependent amidase/aminoacylase/carboxypeptidase family protein
MMRDQIEPAIRRIADGVCTACGAQMKLRCERRCPPTVNHARETEIAVTAAASLVGENNVKREFLPSMGAEDFACFLENSPEPTFGSVAAAQRAAGCCTARIIISMIRYCHWAQAIGCVLLSPCSQRIEPHWESAEFTCAVSLK